MIVPTYFLETAEIAKEIGSIVVDRMIERLVQLKKDKGRLFIVGVGGSAANASHAVNDFRKICGIQAFAPTDNMAELTARINDGGWETSFVSWMDAMRPNSQDALLVLSVGGGQWNTSRNILKAVEKAKLRQMSVLGIVGPYGGYTAAHGDIVLKIPVRDSHFITPETGTPAKHEPCYVTAFTEAFQVVVLHCIVNDGRLR